MGRRAKKVQRKNRVDVGRGKAPRTKPLSPLVFACPFFLARCPLLTESLKQANFGKQKLLSFTKFSKSLDCRDKNYTSNNVSRQKSAFDPIPFSLFSFRYHRTKNYDFKKY